MAYLDAVCSHLDRITRDGLATGYGPVDTPMWMSALDVRTGRYPSAGARRADMPKRVYRNIDAPRGVSLYWDQPQVAAALLVSKLTGDTRYADAVDAYVAAFLAHGVSAQTGLFLWGNHYFWDAHAGCVRFFVCEEDPVPVDPATCPGDYHEARPLMPLWSAFWRVSPDATARAIRAMGAWHVADRETGAFNRHADRRHDHAFLESGGILVESLCWLAARTGERDLVEQATRIARYTVNTRHPATGLIPNSPTSGRWDQYTTTSEIGLWADSLLRAADLSGDDSFTAMAADAVAPYLRSAYDRSTGRLYGRVRVADGSPDVGPKTTPYQPGTHSDPWEPLFPTHDYPMPLGHALLALHARTGRAEFNAPLAVPAPGAQPVYAEHYGRCIRYLHHAARAGHPRAEAQCRALADDAVGRLFRNGMFRTHTGDMLYEAVDGVGLLLLALIELETGHLWRDAETAPY